MLYVNVFSQQRCIALCCDPDHPAECFRMNSGLLTFRNLPYPFHHAFILFRQAYGLIRWCRTGRIYAAYHYKRSYKCTDQIIMCMVRPDDCFLRVFHELLKREFTLHPFSVNVRSGFSRIRRIRRSYRKHFTDSHFRISVAMTDRYLHVIDPLCITDNTDPAGHTTFQPFQSSQSALQIPVIIGGIKMIDLRHDRHPIAAAIIGQSFIHAVSRMGMCIYESGKYQFPGAIDPFFLRVLLFQFPGSSHIFNPLSADQYCTLFDDLTGSIHCNDRSVG